MNAHTNFRDEPPRGRSGPVGGAKQPS